MQEVAQRPGSGKLSGNTLRKILAVVLGVVAGNVAFFLVGMAADRIYPTPPEMLDPQTPEATALRVEAAEANGLLLVLLGSVLGGLVGGVVGARAAREKMIPIAIGALLSLWGFYSLYVFYPARLWFPVGLLVSFPLFSYLGGLATTWSQEKAAGGGPQSAGGP